MKSTTTEELYSIFLKHKEISKDSREIKKNCLYFALKGDNFDGNKFAKKSISNGAAFAIIDNIELAGYPNMIYVGDVLKSLQDLANFHRKKMKIPVLAITGSNGKTTTKELIASVLEKKYSILITEGNYNNHIGVPLTLLKLRNNHELAIIEMGANHQGEINALCDIANPNYGLITNIGKAHLEGFGGIEGVKKGKAELYRFIQKRKGTIFINSDDPVLVELANDLARITYATKKAYCNGSLTQTHPHLKGEWSCNSKIGKFNSNLYGDYNFYNILASICIGNHFKVESNLIDDAINEYSSTINRSQIVEKDGVKIFLDAYNANPSSMKLALENFSNTKGDFKVALLGDMFELGEDSSQEHKRIIEQVLDDKSIKEAILIGRIFFENQISSDKLQYFKTTSEAKKLFITKAEKKGTIFLIKGSRGMALENILN